MKTCLFVLLACGSLAGCSVMNEHVKVPGWPELKIIEHHVSHAEMRDRCQVAVSKLASPEGCTYFHLDQGEAHIYVSKDFPSPAVLRHERLHAEGYDHIGSRNMLRVLEKWQAKRALAYRDE
jgi:hypothetical protein